MATTNLGRIAMVPKGNWVPGAYRKLDVVRFDGASYLCKLDGTTLDPTNDIAWQILATDGPTGPTGSGSSNLSTQIKIFNLIGPVIATLGMVRFYPPQALTITSVYASIGVQSTNSAVGIVVKKNGAGVVSVSLPANSSKLAPQAVSISITPNDYLTVDVTSTTNGQNLNVILVYT